ncbi:MAG: hypothetical protein IID37_07415 [Planctomycetes bacterium]|nr:hypothetical protein [Planctomycetota bacterium]
MRRGMAIAMVGGLLIAGPALAAEAISPKTGSGIPAPDLVNQVLNLSASEVVTLDVPDTPGEAILVTVPIAGVEYTLDLQPQSVRAPGYQLLVQVEDGSMIQTQPGMVRTLRGSLAEVPGSIVAGSLLDSGLKARIVLPDDSGSYWIESLVGHFPDADENLYVIYHEEDALPSEGRCGVDGSLRIDGAEHGGQVSGRGAACGTGLCTAELGIDADFEYFQDHGSSVPNTEAQIEAVINTMNVQYETETDITHLITAIIVRTSEPDPYSSSNPFTLLDQFVAEWQANQGGIPHDAAQLFTGKNLNGGIIGVAFVGQVCLSFDFSLVESDFDPSFACKTDLSAHELGHLWNALHCGCPSNTMNGGFLTCANDFHDTLTVPVIVSFRNSRTCLDDGDPGEVPANNACGDVSVDTLNPGDTLSYTGDLTGATLTCAALGALGETWHAFDLTATEDVTTDHCGTVPVFGNAFIVIEPQCPCSGAFIFADNFDQNTCADGNWSIHYLGVPAGDYWTPVILDPAFGNDGPYSWNISAAGGEGGIPCGDISQFQAACGSPLPDGSLGMRVTFTDSTHSGETVTFTLSGSLGVLVVDRPVIGNRAQLLSPPVLGGTGDWTVELTDPAGCVAPITVTCD